MAPLKAVGTKKSTAVVNSENLPAKIINTRSSKLLLSSSSKKDNLKETSIFPKRKAVSPIKGKSLKRSALGNITNVSIQRFNQFLVKRQTRILRTFITLAADKSKSEQRLL